MLPVLLLSCLSILSAVEYLKLSSPISEHLDVEVPLKSCGKNDGVIFELVDLPLDTKFEFRISRVSAELPVQVDMELMSKSEFETGVSQRIINSVKRVFASGNPHDEPYSETYKDVDRISFIPNESTMYVRVTADFNGEVRADKASEKELKCGPLRASFIFEKLYFNLIPCTTFILITTCTVLMILFWVVGLPLMTWALGPQLLDETKEPADKKLAETKKNQ